MEQGEGKNFVQTIEEKESVVKILIREGSSLMAAGDSGGALAQFENAYKLMPKKSAVLRGRGRALYYLGRVEEAVACYDELDTSLAEQGDDDAVEIIRLRGNAMHDLGRFEEALQAYDAYLKKKNDATVLCNRGSVLHELGRCEDALESFNRSFFLRPLSAEAMFNRGCVLQSLGRLEEAYRSYSSSLEIEKDADCLCNRGTVAFDLGLLDRAFADFDEVLRIRPGDDDVERNRQLVEDAMREAVLRKN